MSMLDAQGQQYRTRMAKLASSRGVVEEAHPSFYSGYQPYDSASGPEHPHAHQIDLDTLMMPAYQPFDNSVDLSKTVPRFVSYDTGASASSSRRKGKDINVSSDSVSRP
jgi:hypothetical protein